MAGGGDDTENSRWDDAVKYRITLGPVHLEAMYEFADGSAGCYSATAGWTAGTCTAESAHNNAYGFDLGATYRKFSVDIVPQHYNPAISVLNPLLGALSLTHPYSVHRSYVPRLTPLHVPQYHDTIDPRKTKPTQLVGAKKCRKHELLRSREIPNVIGTQQAWQKLDLYRGDYNHHRPHSALADRTPAEFASICSGGNDGAKAASEKRSAFPTSPPHGG